MKKTAAILLTLSLMLSLCACGGTVDSSETAPVPKYDVCVDFSTVETDEVWDEGSGDLIFTQSICIPNVVAAGTRDAVKYINKDIAHRCELFKEGADAIKAAALSLADENAKPNNSLDDNAEEGDGVSERPCAYSTKARLSRGDTGVISINYDIETYSGGAHGYISRESATYDAKTGRILSLDSISDEPELLKQLVYGYILNISTGEKYKDPNGESIFFEPDMTEAATEIIESGNWYMSSEGLVFFANPYELAPFGYGRIDFTVPYAAMDGLLKEEYIPAALEGENGIILAQSGDTMDTDTVELLGTVVLDEEGQSVVLTAEETVYRVELVLCDFDLQEETLLWYRSYMTTSEAVELVSYIPDTMPNVILRYTMADGTVIERGIFQSGEDGSILLTEVAAS